MKKFLFKLKKILLSDTEQDTEEIRQYIKAVYYSKFFKALKNGLVFLLAVLDRLFGLLLHCIKNLFFVLISIIILVYLVLNTIIIDDYMKGHYSWYRQLLCQIDATDKLKHSVVRIVGGLGEGSGFFINNNEVMTNFHVIDGEPSPKIIFPDGTFITPTKIIGNQKTDLAILFTEKSYPNLVFPLPQTLTFDQNQELISAGYPLGTDLNGPATVVSGHYLEYRKSRKEEVGYIQTDFALVSGMSGGPLVDVCGNVVGINTMSMSGQSLFIGASAARDQRSGFTDQEITKIEVDPSLSPESAVTGFYTYLKARRMLDGYNLLSASYKKYATEEEWTNRFNDIIDVEVISVTRYNKTNDTSYIKFITKNWVSGEVDYHYYQGTWKTVKEEGIYKLSRSNIEEISEPDWEWLYK